MNQHPKIIIQILHYGNIDDTLECLESVYKQNYPNYYVLIIDNDSSNNNLNVRLEKFHQLGRIKLIKNKKNLGFTGGHNIGFHYSLQQNAKYIWVLNNDTIILPDTLEKLVRDIDSNPKIGAVSPIIYHFGSNKIQYLASTINIKTKQISYTKSFDELDRWKQDNLSFCLWGTALLIRASILTEIGFFYEKLFAYYEDTEFSYRILKNGYINKITENALIYHKHEHIDNGLRKPHFYFYMARNELLYLKKHSSNFQLIKAYRICLLDMLEWLSICLRHNNDECVNAVLDGFYCGCINYGGAWTHDRHMPKIIASFLKRFAWPLYRLLSLK
jgi:GT2 family glycosyltransferase